MQKIFKILYATDETEGFIQEETPQVEGQEEVQVEGGVEEQVVEEEVQQQEEEIESF